MLVRLLTFPKTAPLDHLPRKTNLILVMWETGGNTATTWKDQVLPYVFHGLTPDVGDKVQQQCKGDIDAMEDHAK